MAVEIGLLRGAAEATHLEGDGPLTGRGQCGHDDRRDERQKRLRTGEKTALGLHATASLCVGDRIHRAGHLRDDLEHGIDDVAELRTEALLLELLDQLRRTRGQHEDREAEQHVQDIETDVRSVEKSFLIKVNRSQGEEDGHVLLVEDALDDHDGQDDREGEGQQREGLMHEPRTLQKQDAEQDHAEKDREMPGNQRHRDRRDEIEDLRERMKLRQPGAVVRIKRDGFHDVHPVDSAAVAFRSRTGGHSDGCLGRSRQNL